MIHAIKTQGKSQESPRKCIFWLTGINTLSVSLLAAFSSDILLLKTYIYQSEHNIQYLLVFERATSFGFSYHLQALFTKICTALLEIKY